MNDRKRNCVEIPPEALEGRPIFVEPPGEDVETEILDFIRETLAPHLWRGHTHTKFSKDEPFEYINEYQLLPGREAPCPCCSPFRPKYYRKGVIVWFPREGVIRLVGGDCFKGMMGAEAHRAASERYERVKRRKADIAVILQNLDALPATLSAINHTMPIAKAIDRFRDDLRGGTVAQFTRGLWRHVKEGSLTIEEKDGRIRAHASIAGQSILDSATKPVLPRLQMAHAMLENLELGTDPEGCVKAMQRRRCTRCEDALRWD
jgi:hypothetical protein